MTDQTGEVILYYQITLAVHVDLANERVNRVVELREEIHSRDSDPVMILAGGDLVECAPRLAADANRIAETTPWPGGWEFGY